MANLRFESLDKNESIDIEEEMGYVGIDNDGVSICTDDIIKELPL